MVLGACFCRRGPVWADLEQFSIMTWFTWNLTAVNQNSHAFKLNLAGPLNFCTAQCTDMVHNSMIPWWPVQCPVHSSIIIWCIAITHRMQDRVQCWRKGNSCQGELSPDSPLLLNLTRVQVWLGSSRWLSSSSTELQPGWHTCMVFYQNVPHNDYTCTCQVARWQVQGAGVTRHCQFSPVGGVLVWAHRCLDRSNWYPYILFSGGRINPKD